MDSKNRAKCLLIFSAMATALSFLFLKTTRIIFSSEHFDFLNKYEWRTENSVNLSRLQKSAGVSPRSSQPMPTVDTQRSFLSLDELIPKLTLVNLHGPDAYNFDLFDYEPRVWINLTSRRLQLRVDQRLSQSSLYIRLLNASFDVMPNTSEKLRLSHVMYQGGLGNFLFQTAGLIGMSVKNRRSPSVLEYYWANKYFHNFKLELVNLTDYLGNDTLSVKNAWTVFDSGWGRYSPQLENVTKLKGHHNILLAGYMQSWKYFHFIRDDIRSLFTFSNTVYRTAIEATTKVMERYRDSVELDNLPWLIGIHVRRGDILNLDQTKHGHQPASEEYLLRAALHFQRSYVNTIFIVLSNDIAYCKKLFVEANFLFVEQNNEAVDMAVLSLMDHLILSVGTYGWWGAYLSDAKDVFYYKHWPRNASDMAASIHYDDYFLPNWIPFE